MSVPYTIRSVPRNLHHAWKVVSSLRSVSMRVYILRALRRQLELDIDAFKQKDVLKEDLKKRLEVI